MDFYALADSALQSIWRDYHELDGASHLSQSCLVTMRSGKNWLAESVDELGVHVNHPLP